MEARRRGADQRRNCVFILRTLDLQQLQLRSARLEQRLLLRQIQAGGETELVARVHEAQRLSLQLQIALQHIDFGVKLPQREIIGCQLRDQQQARVLVISRRLFGGGARTFDLAPHAAEQIEFVIDRGADQ